MKIRGFGRARLLVAGAAVLSLVGAAMIAFAGPASAATGFYVSNGRLYEANGAEFVMRGTSHAHTWYPSQTSSFANIKARGANTVRVVLSGGRWTANTAADVANVVSLCKANRLICVLENHDTTGYGEQDGAVSLDTAVNYWIGLQSVLTGQERYVIINIGNEPWGNTNASGWTAATTAAITRMRNAGFDHTLMVDAPNWGQDWENIMRNNARTVWNSDPDKNLLFSVHMYGVYDTAAEITSYLNYFRSENLPIVVGEFGFNHSDGNPDEDTIMATAQSLGIGYLGWSWSGNGGGVEYLDQVTNFDPNQLTSWGERLFNGANGIRATAREASVYSGQQPSSSPPVSPSSASPRPPSSPPASSSRPSSSSPVPSGGCAVTYRVTGSWPGGFQGSVTIANTGTTAVNGWTLGWTFANGQTINNMWGGTPTVSGGNVSVVNAGYTAAIPASGSVTIGFIGNATGTNTNPTAFALNGRACSVL
jgi:mannan endo-1,4-beta-mannosidase